MEKILNDGTLREFLSLIDEAQKVVICAHVGPDGDAVGSSLVIKQWLVRRGKQVEIILPNAFPDFLSWMPGAEEIKIFYRHEVTFRPIIQAADLFFIVDMNQPTRLMGLEEAVMANSAPKIMIDHHLNPSDFCQVTVSRPDMCATGEVLCHLLYQLGDLDNITPEMAVCIYAAMMCDTGAFTYASSRPEVYECISKLLARGIDKDRIYRNVYWTYSPTRMRLMGYMLYVKMELMLELNASIMVLTNEERRMFGIKNGDTEGFVNMPLQMSGMRLSVFLSEDTENSGLVKVSLRSVDDFPCDEMAVRFFNGGGHRNASGGRLFCTMEEAVEKTKEAIRFYAPQLSAKLL